MKAISINDKYVNQDVIPIPVGSVVTVSQSDVFPDAYDVAEYPRDKQGERVVYGKKHFIPLSSIDETEMERNYYKQNVKA